MSLYGYELDNTPNLKKWIRRGATVFHDHYAGGNYTSPGTASLLTGTLPWTHRTFNLRGVPADSVVDLGMFNQFAEAGYHTLGFTQNMNAAVVMQKLGQIDTNVPYDAWHLHYNDVSHWFPHLPDNDYQVKSIADDSLAGWQNGSMFTSFFADVLEIWQTQRSRKQDGALYPLGYPEFAADAGSFRFNEVIDGITNTILGLPEPFMAYVHLFPPHAPFRPTQPFYDAFKDTPMPLPPRRETPFDQGLSDEYVFREQNHYDAFVAEVDAEFGRVMQMLDDVGKLDNTWVVFTADHGELFSNGIADHFVELMSDDLLRVPLILFPPKQPDTVAIDSMYIPTSCIDVLPTLLHQIGRPIDERYEGRLLPGLGGDMGEPPVFAVEAKQLNRNAPLTQTTSLMVRRFQYKLERYIGYPGVPDFHRLFDLENDPLELNDIAQSEKGVAADLLALLQKAVAPYQ